METIPFNPVKVPRSNRVAIERIMTDFEYGKFMPMAYFPLLQGDSVRNGKFQAVVRSREMVSRLKTGMKVRFQAWLVPNNAFDRFNKSEDELIKSYNKEAGLGGSVVDYIVTNKSWNGSSVLGSYDASTWDTSASNNVKEFYQHMGIHHQNAKLNIGVVESYNTIRNHRAKSRSQKLFDAAERNVYDHSFAPAFWIDNPMGYIKESFDSDVLAGEINFSGLSFQAPIRSKELGALNVGYGRYNNNGSVAQNSDPGSWSAFPLTEGYNGTGSSDSWTRITKEGTDYIFQDIWAELQAGAGQGAIIASLADIEQAKKLASWAQLRAAYSGVDDDALIERLLDGLGIPNLVQRAPVPLDSKVVSFVANERFATDGASLDESVTDAVAACQLSIRTPVINGGGQILITCEICPDMMFERKEDKFLTIDDQDDYPKFVRDYLDNEKVEKVTNSFVDVNHSSPNGTFGYAHLNHSWQNRDFSRIGGSLYRPSNDAFTEDRAGILAVEQADMTLQQSFYTVPTLHKKIFADTVKPGFECEAIGNLNINGLTVFGDQVVEATDDYDEVKSQLDNTRIDQSS